MGNVVASSKGGRRVKVMKLDGEVLKFKAPLTVEQLLQNYPNHVILHSEAVRHLSTRAKPLEGSTQLNHNHLYFLLEKPMIEGFRAPGRVRSGINLSAKSRLEAMLLERRSSSDISALASSNLSVKSSSSNGQDGAVRVKVRLSKAQLAQLTLESENSSDAAAKILDLYCLNDSESPKSETCSKNLTENQGVGSSHGSCVAKAPRNRVRFSSNVETVEVF